MYIVYVVAYIADISGGPRVVVEQANRLIKRGHKVEIWTAMNDDGPYFKTDAAIKQYDNKNISSPDIVIVTEPSLVPEVCDSRKKPGTFLLLQHDNEWVVGMNEGAEAVARAGLSKEKRVYFEDGRCEIIVVSTWLQEIVKNRYGLDSHLVANGIDQTVFYPQSPLIDTKDPVAMLLHDPQKWKGFEESFLALVEVKKEFPKLKIIVVGRFMPDFPSSNGSYSSFSEPVLYFNRPSQEDLARIYCSASVFVSASWLEGFGLPGLEALACGVPLVTTDSGGVREYADPDKSAIVVPPGDVAGLADGVSRVLSQKSLREKLTRNGLKKAADCNWDKSIDELERLFKKY